MCPRPAGSYRPLIQILDERDAEECTATGAFLWSAKLTGGDPGCEPEPDVYGSAGCTVTSRITCADGQYSELRCRVSKSATLLECLVDEDYLSSTCNFTVTYERESCPAPLVVDDGICHEPCAEDEEWSGLSCEASS